MTLKSLMDGELDGEACIPQNPFVANLSGNLLIVV